MTDDVADGALVDAFALVESRMPHTAVPLDELRRRTVRAAERRRRQRVGAAVAAVVLICGVGAGALSSALREQPYGHGGRQPATSPSRHPTVVSAPGPEVLPGVGIARGTIVMSGPTGHRGAIVIPSSCGDLRGRALLDLERRSLVMRSVPDSAACPDQRRTARLLGKVTRFTTIGDHTLLQDDDGTTLLVVRNDSAGLP